MATNSNPKPTLWQRIKNLPSYVWIITLLIANALTCVALFQACDEASGRGVDASRFDPNAPTENDEEEYFEADYQREQKEESVNPIDTMTFPQLGEEEFDENADLNTPAEDELLPPAQEEVLDPNMYDGVEVDENIEL